jgi:hypothetical protein
MGERKIMHKRSLQGVSALIIVAIVVVAVVVVGVGVYLGTRGGSSPGSSATPTPGTSATSGPTATGSPGATSTPKPTSAATSSITTATSYEFNETGTAANGTVLDTLFYATKNLGTSNVELIEIVSTPSSGGLEYIVNGVQQKAWIYTGGQWTDISTEYATQLSTVQSTAGLYTNMLEYYGSGGSFTYTIPAGQTNAGDKATFTNIQINPSLPDSLFQPPT